MAYSQAKKDELRSYYVYERLPLKVAAEKAKIPYNTARIWKRAANECNDNWERARSASRVAEGGLGDITAMVIEDFAILFKSTMEEITKGDYDGLKKASALAQLTDAYAKAMKAATGGNPQIARLSVALEVLKELAGYIKEQYPGDLQRFTAILESFAPHANEVFG